MAKVRCVQCGEYRASGKHQCRVRQGPPPAASPMPSSVAPSATPAPAAAAESRNLGGDDGIGEMLILTAVYDDKRDAVDSSGEPQEHMAAILELEQAAEDLAASPDGYQHVLKDAAQLLENGNVDRAALLSRAAARGADAQTKAPATQESLNAPPSTHEQRRAAAAAAEEESRRLDRERRDQALRAGGAFAAEHCQDCNHTHPGQRCICGCRRYREPTAEQVLAHELDQAHQRVEREWSQLAQAANSFMVGDRCVVSGGTSAPDGFRGCVVRTHQGKWGLRALVKTLTAQSSEEYWVSVQHLTHTR